ncbi:hypothetical protein PISMIDRAFT_677508, partial [Pisolithus microcarpus 441]
MGEQYWETLHNIWTIRNSDAGGRFREPPVTSATRFHILPSSIWRISPRIRQPSSETEVTGNCSV